jgi:hypothetical protein
MSVSRFRRARDAVESSRRTTYNRAMSEIEITDELVQRVTDDLRARYSLDDEDVRALGARLAESVDERRRRNLEFSEQFTDAHRETFDRLAK